MTRAHPALTGKFAAAASPSRPKINENQDHLCVGAWSKRYARQTPPWHLLVMHLLLFWQLAPTPPQYRGQPVPAGQVVLSVQSAVDWQSPPMEFSKHRPPTHLFERHWVSAVHVVPGQEAMHLLVAGLQFPLWHWAPVAQVSVPP
jgi:hypothetical protein